MRLKYKKQGNPLQLVIKLVMNAAYGICGLKPIDTDIKYVQDGEKYDNFVNLHFNRIKWFTRMNNSDWRFELYKEIDTHYNRQHVACEVLTCVDSLANIQWNIRTSRGRPSPISNHSIGLNYLDWAGSSPLSRR